MAGASDPKKFNLKIVHDSFKASVVDADDVRMDSYIEAYKELYKFFNLLGTLFGFVGSDVQAKIEILEALCKDDTDGKYSTFRKMITHERDSSLLRKDDFQSGSRTLLRLHRGLDFIKLFLRRLEDMNDEDSTSGACKECYGATLGLYHPWLIRQGAYIAISTLPARGALLLRTCGNGNDVLVTLELLPRTLEVIDDVYQRTHKMYDEFSLHDLP